MSSILKWICEHKGMAALILFIFLVFLFWGVPMFISTSFIDEGGIPVNWQADDFLLFYGSFLAFAGTTILGLVSWRENQNIKKEMNRLERNRYLIENRPDFLLSPIITSQYNGWDKLTIGDVQKKKYTMIQFKIDNIGNGIARAITMQLCIRNRKHDIKYSSNGFPDCIKLFPPTKKIDTNSMKYYIISIDNEIVNFNDIIEKDDECLLILRFFDDFENKYEQRFNFLTKRIYHENDENIPKRNGVQIFGRCSDVLDIDVNRVSCPKLIKINDDFNKLYLL